MYHVPRQFREAGNTAFQLKNDEVNSKADLNFMFYLIMKIYKDNSP